MLAVRSPVTRGQGFLWGVGTPECSCFGRKWVKRKQREGRTKGFMESHHKLKQRKGWYWKG